MLNTKSLEVYEAMRQSAHSQRLLELALWASGESIWEWSSGRDELVIRSYPTTEGTAVLSEGSVADSRGTSTPTTSTARRCNGACS